MRISDWSSDVCSSDLPGPADAAGGAGVAVARARAGQRADDGRVGGDDPAGAGAVPGAAAALHPGAAARERRGVSHRACEPLVRAMANARPWMAGQGDPEPACLRHGWQRQRSEEHTSELQSLMRISYAVFCLKK